MNSVLYNCCPDHKAPNWKQFDALELHGVYVDDYGQSHHTNNLHEINCWSIFGHLLEGGTECITDCKSLEQARDVLKRLEFVSGLKTTYSL